jgi:polyferredoxin
MLDLLLNFLPEKNLVLLKAGSFSILIAMCGGFILFCIKCGEHFNRKESDKMPISKYLLFLIGIFLFLPISGATVAAVYIMNGDQLSSVLAFQVGLTSPAIIQSFMATAANKMAQNNQEIESGQ